MNIIYVLTLWYIHLLHPGGLKLVVAVLLPSLLNSASLPSDPNFLTVFPLNGVYITKVSLCVSTL